MNRILLFLAFLIFPFSLPEIRGDDKLASEQGRTSVENGTVTVRPIEFPGAINNPLKGFRDYKEKGYGLVVRQYIPWNRIEVGEGDSVDRIIAHTNEITRTKGKNFEDLNLKLVPRVYLDWDGSEGTAEKPMQHWPADLHRFDYDSPAFQSRLRALVAKLGEAWDNDPRIFAVQMGLIGRWGEHHSPSPTAAPAPSPRRRIPGSLPEQTRPREAHRSRVHGGGLRHLLRHLCHDHPRTAAWTA
jgi:hypothetical protein